MGGQDGGEDPPGPGVRAAPRGPDAVAGRLGRGQDHRPGGDVPGPPGGREDLLQPGPAVGPGAADLLPVRAVGGRRGLHPGLLRRGLHGRAQRLHVPGVAPHGRDGDRREGHPGGDGRGGHALPGVGLRRPALRRRGRGHPGRPPLPVLLPGELARRPTGRGPSGAGLRRAGGPAGPDRRVAAVRRLPAGRGRARRGELLRDQARVRRRGGLRAGPDRGPGRRDRGQPADGQGWGPVRRLGRQGGPVRVAVRRLQPAAGVPGRRARVHDRDRGRAPGHHPPRGQADHRGQRGHRAQDLRGRPQGLRGRAVRHGRARVRARRHPGPAHRLDRRDGPGGGRQRRLLQQAGRAARGRAAGRGRAAPARVPRGRRPGPAGRRPGRGRGGRPRRPPQPSCPAAWPPPPARSGSSPTAATGCPRYDPLPLPVRAGGQPGGDRRAGAAGLPGAGADRDRRPLRPGRGRPARARGRPGGGHRRVGGGRVLPRPGQAAGRGRRGRGRGRPPRVRAAERARRLRPGGDRGRG